MSWTFAKTRAVACIAALAAVCLTLSPRPPADPVLGVLLGPLRTATVGGLEGAVLLAGVIGLLLILVTFIVALRERVKSADTWRLLLMRLAAITAVYGILALLSTFRHAPQATESHVIPPARPMVASTKPAPPPQVTPATPLAAPSRSPFILGGMALLAAAGVLGFILWKTKPRAKALPVPDEPSPLAAVRHRLELGDQVRDAIIACYGEMCDIFAPRTASPYRSLTAREFASLLRSRGAGEPEILALTSVFEKARYSDEPCGEADRTRALGALKVLESHYGQPGEA